MWLKFVVWEEATHELLLRLDLWLLVPTIPLHHQPRPDLTLGLHPVLILHGRELLLRVEDLRWLRIEVPLHLILRHGLLWDLDLLR